jgi:hypothetical protein
METDGSVERYCHKETRRFASGIQSVPGFGSGYFAFPVSDFR